MEKIFSLEDLNKLILEQVDTEVAQTQQVSDKEKQEKEFQNAGIASEYTTYLAFIQKFKDFSKENNLKLEIKQDLDPNTADTRSQQLTRKTTNPKNNIENVRQESINFVNTLFNDLYFKENFLYQENDTLKSVFISYTGQEESGKSSADLSITLNFENGNKKFKISLKRKNPKIYGSSRYKPFDVNSSDVKKIPSKKDTGPAFIKDKGGGPIKLFKVFGYTENNNQLIDTLNNAINDIESGQFSKKPDPLIIKKNSIKKLFNNFYKYLNKELSGDKSKENVYSLFNVFFNLMTRADEEVELFADLYQKPTMFMIPVVERYIGHIEKIDVTYSNKNEGNPTIKFKLSKNLISKFENTLIKKDKTLNKNIYDSIYKLAASANDISSEIKSSDEQKGWMKNAEKLFSIFKIPKKINLDDRKILSEVYSNIVESANNLLLNLTDDSGTFIFQVGYKFANITPEKKGRDDTQFAIAGTKFKKFANTMNLLYNLEKDSSGNVQRFLKLIDNLLKKSMIENKTQESKINEYVISLYKKFNQKLIVENKNKQKTLSKIKKEINSLNKEDLGIISITPSNKSDAALVVRCKDKENIESVRSSVKSAIDGMGLSASNRVIAKFEPSTESTEIKMNDGSGGVYIVYKYDTGSREGLALEHVMALLLTKKVTPELKNRLDLPPEASKEEVKEKLKTDYSDVLSTAFQGKKLIDEKIGEITDARSEGSRNSKADLILTTANGHTYGLSIKLVTEQGREVRFTYNKNLGYGDDEEDTLVKSPNGRPWWLIGRQNFAKKLGRQFKGNPEDLEPPSWMTKAKESKSDLYKEAMEETYAALREVFVDNLRRMKLKELVDMVNEAHTGGEQEEEYEKLFVLTSDVDGIRLESKGHEQPDIQKIKMSGVKKTDIVKMDGARIIIDIPGMSPLTIHGLKFHSNMLSSNREDLKIKTR